MQQMNKFLDCIYLLGRTKPQDAKEIPDSNCVTFSSLHRSVWKLHWQRFYKVEAFFSLSQSGCRKELVTLFNPKFFSQKPTFQKEMKTSRVGGGGGEREESMKEIGTFPNGL
jgi:hypothetical protein